MTNICVGLGRVLGHKFVAVFDEEPVNPNVLNGLGRFEAPVSFLHELLQANIRRTYVGSVCIRCGTRTHNFHKETD